MKDDKKALVLFSGGKDSLIVTLRLLDSNWAKNRKCKQYNKKACKKIWY